MDEASNHRVLPTERNPQISLPLLVGALIFVGLAVGVNFGTNEAVGQWARIAMILLAIPAVILALITLVVLVAFIYLAARLTGLIPPYAFLAQEFFVRVAQVSRQAADKVVEPILRLNAFTAGLGALRRK